VATRRGHGVGGARLLLAQLYAAWWSFFGFGLMLDFEKEAVFLII
jgi:hypothetical protein